MSAEGATATAMAAAATQLLAALGPDQRSAVRLPFEHPERCTWSYLPGVRRGVSLAEMDRGAAKSVHRLLTHGLSCPAHARVAAITGLEDILDVIEGGGRQRHAGDYWTLVFGDPGADEWGWRFEGHHISVNLTMVDGAVSATPCFLGANPAIVTDDDGRALQRPLGPEEDLGWALLASLDQTQRDRALFSHEAPDDILTGRVPDPARFRPPPGLPAAALRPDQVALLRALAATYIGRLAPALAAPSLARLDQDLAAFEFSWAGETTPGPGKAHYYRILGPRYLVELDNQQNGANHVHSVWREPGGDFGARLLTD